MTEKDKRTLALEDGLIHADIVEWKDENQPGLINVKQGFNLFGVLRGRQGDIDWYDNPHRAVAECKRLKLRKVIWLAYTPGYEHPHYKSNAWQVIHNLSRFDDSIAGSLLDGFAPADSPVWQDNWQQD